MPRFALIPGDGIGVEVTAEVVKVLHDLRDEGLPLQWESYDYSADRYLRTGEGLPDGALSELADFDAIFVGAFGDPRVPDMAHARDILLGLRFKLDLYVNERPVMLLSPSHTPLKGHGPEEVDFVVLRENTEGAYVGTGGFLRHGTPDEVAVQESLATRKGVDRILRYAFERASFLRRGLVMADKHNAMQFVSDLWYRAFREMAGDYPEVASRHLYADALCHELVRDPSQFGVIVTDNLFGDLISDLGAALAGGLGLAPSGNINPETRRGLFEPVHGSAPDLAGKELANPMAALRSAAMMLGFVGEAEAGARLEAAVRACAQDGQTTPDLGGRLGTRDVGEAIRQRLKEGGGG
jgi:3-isopropylmalate dehydrogenase